MRKRFLQFSIRSLLCFVVVIAGLLAFLRTFGCKRTPAPYPALRQPDCGWEG